MNCGLRESPFRPPKEKKKKATLISSLSENSLVRSSLNLIGPHTVHLFLKWDSIEFLKFYIFRGCIEFPTFHLYPVSPYGGKFHKNGQIPSSQAFEFLDQPPASKASRPFSLLVTTQTKNARDQAQATACRHTTRIPSRRYISSDVPVTNSRGHPTAGTYAIDY